MARIARITAVSVVFVLLAAGLAMADTFTCNKDTCYGTNHRDKITGTDNSQDIFGLRRDDLLRDRAGHDRDLLSGNAGDDRLNDNDGDSRDVIRGGPGYDVCIGDRGDTFRGCEDVIKR